MQSIVKLVFVAFTLLLILIAFEAQAGRYDGISDLFNSVAKNIKYLKPNKLDHIYRPHDFDPPGFHGPSIGTPPQPTTAVPFIRRTTKNGDS